MKPSTLTPTKTEVFTGSPLGPGLCREPGPLPEAVGDRRRQPRAERPSYQHDLTTMMGLVGHEVAEHVAHVEREVAPGIEGARRDGPAGLPPDAQQLENASA